MFVFVFVFVFVSVFVFVFVVSVSLQSVKRIFKQAFNGSLVMVTG